MPDWLTQGLLLQAVIVLATFVLAEATRHLNNAVTRRTKLGIPFKLCAASIFTLCALGVAFKVESWTAVFVSVLAGIALTYTALRPLLRIGIIEAFSHTESGIGYSDSLKLAHHSISFMGIGAHKLTSIPEFEKAVRRCTSSGSRCRFLLSRPDNPLLEKLARQNNAVPKVYADNVKASLTTLANLHINSGLNIDVRYHPAQDRRDFQQFRLMFLDGDICLMSWAVWDAAMGRNNPQILLRQSGSPESRKATLFKAFEDYFDETWSQAEDVPLKDFL